MAKGIDIYSRYQTVTNWPAVKASGVSYVWVKLSDGSGLPNGGRNPGDGQVTGAKAAGIPVGGYHFSQPGSAERQADIFIAEVRRLGATGLVPMLDLEDNPPKSNKANIPDSQKKAWGIAFCRQVASHGFRPGVYMNNALAKLLRPDTWGITGLAIWIARYGAKPDAAAGRYDVHQYSSAGSVPGITGSVDLNESYTTAHIYKPQEDDMAWTEADFNTPLFTDNVGTPTARVIRFRDAMSELRVGMKATTTALQQALQLLADSPDLPVTEERLKEIFREVVKAETGPVVREVLGEDNAEQADAIVNELTQRLQLGSN